MITGGLLECIRRYRRTLNRATNTFTTPAQDQFTDGADFLRYVCVNADKMVNENDWIMPPLIQDYGVLDAGVGY